MSEVAAHYNKRPNLDRWVREHSPIIQLKKFNNVVKAVLLKMFCQDRMAVVDYCCGKGGDLKKFDIARIRYLVGFGEFCTGL